MNVAQERTAMTMYTTDVRKMTAFFLCKQELSLPACVAEPRTTDENC
jgi:hypothetical protein